MYLSGGERWAEAKEGRIESEAIHRGGALDWEVEEGAQLQRDQMQ